jgi:hypothetical protein
MVRSKKLPSWIEYFISPASLATWIMDEGFRESKGLTIRLFDFSKEDCTKLALILFKKFNLKTSVKDTNNINQFNLFIEEDSMPLLNSLTKDYMIGHLLSKIHISSKV